MSRKRSSLGSTATKISSMATAGSFHSMDSDTSLEDIHSSTSPTSKTASRISRIQQAKSKSDTDHDHNEITLTRSVSSHDILLLTDEEPAVADSNLVDDETSVCPVTTLTGREKNLIWKSWKAMYGVGQKKNNEFSHTIGVWLFAVVSGMKDRFERVGVKMGNMLFETHSQFITGELDKIINLLTRPEAMVVRVDKLAKQHVNQDTGSKYFEQIEKNIHLFVEMDVRGKYVNVAEEEVKQTGAAWGKLIGILNKAMVTEEKKQKVSLWIRIRNACRCMKK